MERTNESWVEHLQDNSPYQAEAIEELRSYLKRGVLGYLYDSVGHIYVNKIIERPEQR